MSHFIKDTEEIIHAIETEEELIEESRHKGLEHSFLHLRNVAVALAAVLFIVSMCPVMHPHFLRGIAYIFGACAYFFELLMLTDLFSKKVEHRELFMIYCFGPLYILLGISYLFGH